MTPLDGFTSGTGLWWRFDERKNVVEFVPSAVGLQHDETGAPLVFVTPLGSSIAVQLAVQWTVEADQLRVLKASFTTDPRLSPLDTGPAAIRLLVRRPGIPLAVATAVTSGYGSHNALLTATIGGPARAELIAALSGESGHAWLELTASVPAPGRRTRSLVLTTDLAGDCRGHRLVDALLPSVPHHHPTNPTTTPTNRNPKGPPC